MLRCKKWRGLVVFLIVLLGTSGVMCSLGMAVTREIRLMTTESDPSEVATLELLIEQYEEENPEIKIVPEYVSWSDMSTKIATVVAGGMGPQIALMGPWLVNEFGNAGMLEPTNDIIDHFGRNDWFANKLASLTINGKIYGVPFVTSSWMLWYRPDLFEGKGLSVPKTRAELLTAAEKFTEDLDGDGSIDRYGIAMMLARSEATREYFLVNFWADGGRIFDDQLKAHLDSPEVIETLKYLRQLYQFAPPGSINYQWIEAMHAYILEKSVMTMYPGRVLSHVERYNPRLLGKVDSALWPGKTRGRTFSTGENWVFIKGSRNVKDAKDFITWLCEDKQFIKFAWSVPGQLVSCRKSLAFSKEYLEHPLLKQHKHVSKVQFEGIKNGWVLSYEGRRTPDGGKLFQSDILDDMVQKVIIGGEKPEAAAAWAQKETEKLLRTK